MTTCDPDRLAALTPADLAGLRDALRAAGYMQACVADFEAIAPRQLDAVRLPAVHHALRRRGDALGTIAAVFMYQGVAAEDDLRRALGSPVLDALIRVGAVLREAERVRAPLRLIPFHGLWFASDEFDGDDPVMGPGMTTDELLRCVSWDGVESALDIGCGAGQITLVARAAGVREAVGVDIDPRAIAYARFNARLNELECEWLQGDLLAPVAGRRFDAIVSQPAYVARPPTVDAVTFLHGGARGDELAHRIIAGLDGALTSRGKAWVLFDAPEPDPATLTASIRASLGAARRDVCIVVSPSFGASDMAIGYASLRDRRLGEGFRAAFEAYCDHLASLGIERLRHVLLHVRSGEPPVGVVVERAAFTTCTDATLGRLLDGSRMSSQPPQRLLAAAIRPALGARLQHEQSLADAERTRLRVVFDGKAMPEQMVSDTAAILLCALRDHAPLSRAIAAFAEEVGLPPDQATAEALAFVREGLRSGLLVAAP
jgi:methylase of polypeptide subunit release factors